MLQIYNTLSGEKETFKPIKPKQVLIYVCGITAYDDCHLGHLRVAVNFDLAVNYLKHKGYEVKYIRNITDIDDKIIKRAQEEKKDFLEISRIYSQKMHEDFAAMGLQEPDFEPRATSYVKEMISFIKNLEEAGLTYQTDKGDLCYRIRNFKDYGKLSQKKIDELRTGVRIEEDESKDDPLDFVLWKAAKENEPSWDSPWGKGRPGWHIECSTMVSCCLGLTIDIHGGGRDLIFPHHENEIAQSEAATRKRLANYWMHCGHLMINGKKMSKSLNNFVIIKDLLAKLDSETIKYFFHSAHYRSQMDYTEDVIKQHQLALENLYRALAQHSQDELAAATDGMAEKEKQFEAALDDDFNTPLALAVLFELAKTVNKEKTAAKSLAAAVSLLKCGNLLGILRQDPRVFLKQGEIGSQDLLDEASRQKINDLIAAREDARKNKDWKKSDELRDKLEGLGVAVEDTAAGVKWHIINKL